MSPDRLQLEGLISELRILTWIVSQLDDEYMSSVSYDKPGVYLIEVDRTAANALAWAIIEAKNKAAALSLAFHGPEAS